MLLVGAYGGSGLGDTEEQIEVEPEEDTNEEGGVNGEATGNVCIFFVQVFSFLHIQPNHTHVACSSLLVARTCFLITWSTHFTHDCMN